MSPLTASALVSAQDWSEWDAFARSRDDASIYHLSDWARVLKRGLGYESRGLAIRDEERRIRAIVPLFEVKGFRGRRLVAVPFRDRGGVLASDALSERAAYEAARTLAHDSRASALVLKSCGSTNDEIARALGFSVSRYWIHSTMTLGKGDLWRRIGKKNRNMVRQAQKSGLSAEWHVGPERVSSWYELHRATQSRLGVPVFPRALFEAILDEGREWARLLLVSGSRGIVAGALFFEFAGRSIYGYSASTKIGQDQRANDLLVFEALRRAEDRGLACFDFGSDSPKQTSLLAFKEKWGALQSTTTVFSAPASSEEQSDSSSPIYGVARSLGRLLPESLWAALTTPLVARLG